MKHLILNLVFILTATMLLITSGCRRQDGQKISEAEKTYSQAMSLMDAGQPSQAITLIEKTLAGNKLNEADVSRLSSMLIDILLTNGENTKAEEKYMQAVAQNTDCVRSSFGRIANYYSATANTEALIIWYDKLLDSNLPAELKQQTLLNLIGEYYSSDQLDIALSVIKERIGSFDATAGNQILHTFLELAINQKKITDAEQILAAITSIRPDDASIKEMAAIAKINIMALKGDWNAVQDSFVSTAPSLDDNSINRLLSRLLTLADTQKELKASEKLIEHVLKNMSGVHASKSTAARKWLANVKGDNTAIVTRLSALTEDTDLTINDQISLVAGSFYGFLQGDQKDCLLKMYNLLETLSTKTMEEGQRQQLILFQLDATFMLEDYEKTLVLLEKGIPERDEAWHKSAIAKLKAHIAMNNNQPEDAVKYFTEFMGYIENQKDPEVDPSTGIRHTKEMILGRNMKRIGDIYANIPNQLKAKEAYEKALKYYETATKDTTQDEAATKLITQEVAELQKCMAAVSESGTN